MLPRRVDQVLARFRRAEGRVRRERNVRQARQRMIFRQRLDVEDVEPGMADVARLQGLDHRVLIDDRAARGVDEDDSGLHLTDTLARDQAAGLVVEQEMYR